MGLRDGATITKMNLGIPKVHIRACISDEKLLHVYSTFHSNSQLYLKQTTFSCLNLQFDTVSVLDTETEQI